MRTNYRIRREADETLLATGSTKHACVDRRAQVARMPKIFEDAVKAAAPLAD